MASINEIAVAAFRIGKNSRELQTRLEITKDVLLRDNLQLARVAQGSRSGQNAVQQVNLAVRVMDTAIGNLATMQRTIDDFIQDLQK